MKIFLAILPAFLLALPALAGEVTVKTSTEFEIGFVPRAWNRAKFVFDNQDEKEWTVESLEANWKGMPQSHVWTDELNLPLPKGKKTKHIYATHCSKGAFESQGGHEAVMEGKFFLKSGEDTKILPFSFTAKEALLEEPLSAITGRYVSITLQKSRFDGGFWQKEALEQMDQAYEAMWQLVGCRPFDGKIADIRESPSRYAWAYAGNPIVLNGSFVPTTVSEYKEGLASFGWTHEMGHNFDCDLRPYLKWNTPSVEFQANIKLLYAFEHMPCSDYLNLRWRGTEYYPLDKGERMAAKKLADRFFLNFGDAYLADQSRGYDTLQSDELQSFFLRIVRIYGWEALEKWYRIIGDVKDRGLNAPETPEGKINLLFAALNKATGQNLIKTYQLWRFPVTEESLDNASKTFGL